MAKSALASKIGDKKRGQTRRPSTDGLTACWLRTTTRGYHYNQDPSPIENSQIEQRPDNN